ncbi:MAG: hypothetical protein ABIL18_00920 [candidate division WOR-3 bacterium]
MEKIRTIELINLKSSTSKLNSRIFICACEPSGDLYASFFVKTQLSGNKSIFGVGGENLKNVNVKLIYNYKDLQTFGFVSGMLSTLRNFKMYQKIARAIFKIQPEIFIAVAYPGINLILCRYAKKLGIRVIYLLPPQIWAWGTFRKYFIKKWTDLIISIFPFECNFYKNRNINVIYWQNPLFEEYESIGHVIFLDYKKLKKKMREFNFKNIEIKPMGNIKLLNICGEILAIAEK